MYPVIAAICWNYSISCKKLMINMNKKILHTFSIITSLSGPIYNIYLCTMNMNSLIQIVPVNYIQMRRFTWLWVKITNMMKYQLYFQFLETYRNSVSNVHAHSQHDTVLGFLIQWACYGTWPHMPLSLSQFVSKKSGYLLLPAHFVYLRPKTTVPTSYFNHKNQFGGS